MKFGKLFAILFSSWLALHASIANALPTLDLQGYTAENGGITVLNSGDTIDPYFAMQALLLAHDNGDRKSVV